MKYFVLFIIVLVSLPITFAYIGHPASEIRAGTFYGGPTSTFSFPGHLRVSNYLYINSILGSGTARIWYDGAGGFGSSGGYLGFGIGTNDYMVISSSGNVGIGTTNPSHNLEVAGGIMDAHDGLIVETRSNDPTSGLENGRMWLIV